MLAMLLEVRDLFADIRMKADTFRGFAAVIDEMDDHCYRQVGNLHSWTMRELSELVEACPGRWAGWVGAQAAASEMAKPVRRRHSSKTYVG